MPAVSVLLPTFNQAAFLPDALAALAAQTFRDFEVIATDDGSTDGTADILRAASVRTVTHGHNKGTAAAINSAAMHATGRYWTWVSSDNVMRPDWLATLVAALEENPTLGAVYSDFRRHDAETGDARDLTVPHYEPGLLLEGENCYFGPSFLIRREVWPEHRGGTAHDLDSWYRVEEVCWTRGLTLARVPAVLCDYRVGPWCTARVRAKLYDAPKWREEALARRAAQWAPATSPTSH